MRMDRDNSPKKCPHETVESLGFNDSTEFLRCLECRSVIVTQHGITLAVPPVRAAG